jgi:hypothetical protein
MGMQGRCSGRGYGSEIPFILSYTVKNLFPSDVPHTKKFSWRRRKSFISFRNRGAFGNGCVEGIIPLGAKVQASEAVAIQNKP